MTDKTLTRQQYQAAVEWANTVRRMASIHGQGVVAAAAIVLATEPPEPETWDDLAEEEWPDYWGSAVEHKKHGRKGWALGRDLDGYITILDADNGLPTDWWLPENTIILPDEPRLHIPGITEEPTPDYLDQCTYEYAVQVRDGDMWFLPILSDGYTTWHDTPEQA